MNYGKTTRLLGSNGMTKNSLTKLSRLVDSDGKMLIAVVHSLQEPWLSITKLGQFRTWLTRIDSERFTLVHFFATPPNKFTNRLDKFNEDLRWRKGGIVSRIRNHIAHVLLLPWIYWIPKYSPDKIEGIFPPPAAIRVNLLDMYATTRWKRLAIMKYFLEETSHEYLVMTTSSSYLRPELLLAKIEKITNPKVYAGSLIPLSEKSYFCSGAQTVLNRAAASEILRNRSKIPVELLDDLGLGVACERLGIETNEIGTININSLDSLRKIQSSTLKENQHFRLKSEKDGMRMDVDIFLELDRRIQSIEEAE